MKEIISVKLPPKGVRRGPRCREAVKYEVQAALLEAVGKRTAAAEAGLKAANVWWASSVEDLLQCFEKMAATVQSRPRSKGERKRAGAVYRAKQRRIGHGVRRGRG